MLFYRGCVSALRLSLARLGRAVNSEAESEVRRLYGRKNGHFIIGPVFNEPRYRPDNLWSTQWHSSSNDWLVGVLSGEGGLNSNGFVSSINAPHVLAERLNLNKPAALSFRRVIKFVIPLVTSMLFIRLACQLLRPAAREQPCNLMGPPTAHVSMNVLTDRQKLAFSVVSLIKTA